MEKEEEVKKERQKLKKEGRNSSYYFRVNSFFLSSHVLFCSYNMSRTNGRVCYSLMLRFLLMYTHWLNCVNSWGYKGSVVFANVCAHCSLWRLPQYTNHSDVQSPKTAYYSNICHTISNNPRLLMSLCFLWCFSSRFSSHIKPVSESELV